MRGLFNVSKATTDLGVAVAVALVDSQQRESDARRWGRGAAGGVWSSAAESLLEDDACDTDYPDLGDHTQTE